MHAEIWVLPCRGARPTSIHWVPESTPHTVFRSVHPFLQGSCSWPRHSGNSRPLLILHIAMRTNNIPRTYARLQNCLANHWCRFDVGSAVSIPELSMGPFCVTPSNPTHQLTGPIQPNPSEKIGPSPTRPNTNCHWLTLGLSLYYCSVSGNCKIGHKIKFNCLVHPNLI